MVRIRRGAGLIVAVLMWTVGCAPSGAGATTTSPAAGTLSEATATLTDGHVTHGVTEPPAVTAAMTNAGPTEAPAESPTEAPLPAAQSAWPGAKSINVVAGEEGAMYVLVGSGSDLKLYRSLDGGETFAGGVVVSQGAAAEVLAVVRPALAVRADGLLSAAWVEFGDAGTSRVRAAFSEDGGLTFDEPALIATTTDPETTMATVTFDPSGAPVVVWLQNSSVRLAGGDATAAAFGAPSVIDDLVCECCQPAPLAVGDRIFVAYRNLVRDASGQANRDIHVASAAAGDAFGEPVQVSDADWPIDACPIAGPALVERSGTLVAAWMDGRFDDGTLTRTDVWVAASADGGATFSTNVRVNHAEGGYNGQPALAVDAQGALHVAWAAAAADGYGLLYTTSSDGGQTFAPEAAVAHSSARLNSVVLAVAEAGQVLVGWTDAGGAHLSPIP